MRPSTIFSLAIGVMVPLIEGAALAPETNVDISGASANGTIGVLGGERVGYRNHRYADCQNPGEVRYIDVGVCHLVAESTHAIKITEISGGCTLVGYKNTSCSGSAASGDEWFFTRTVGLCTRSWNSNSDRARSFKLKCP